MPTISQLPVGNTISASDLVPISQGGSAHAVSVGALLAQTQPAIIVEPPSLLGRISIGPGGPDTIMVGDGLILNNGTLSLNGTLGAGNFNPASLPIQTSISPTDQMIVTSSGVEQLAELGQIRELFTAGSNITIDENGVISGSGLGGGASYSITTLSPVSALSSGDLVGVSQGGEDHTVTYSNFIDGVTIDQVQSATSASDTDTFWVGQISNVMVRQTLGTLWPWVSAKLPLWRRPVIELAVNTTLNGTTHNTAVLVCSSPVSISALTSNIGSGFLCEVINASSGSVVLSGNIVTSNGTTNLSPFQCATIYCVSYSSGMMIFASISGGAEPTVAPGQVYNLAASSINSTSISLSWATPISGGAVATYTVQYRTTGTTLWIVAGQNTASTTFTIVGLQLATSYDFTVVAANNVGTGATSSILTVVTLATGILPGAPTSVAITNTTANGMTCSWVAPALGGTGITYNVQYRVTGQSAWNSATNNLSATMFSLTGLSPATSYDIQITASNNVGSGPSSALTTAQTSSLTGLVTSITWNLAPTGSVTHGVGSIGVNAHVNPATASIQFGFSTSPTNPPTTWTAALNVNSDLWGQYVPTPASAGTWYAWAEGTDGSAPTVYATPFTVT
jgi:hypothetical protein